MKVSVATKKLLSLSMLAGVGPAALKKVASVPDFEILSVEDLALACVPLRKALSSSGAWELASEQADVQVELADKHESRIISALDFEYPPLLMATKDDPFIIFVRGKLYSESQRSVAIIGTREPTRHGEIIARRITEFFVDNHWSVVSGLALGCDGIAHKAAIEAGGHTVAVLAHGLQMIAPSQHRKLAEEIVESGGALISEYPFGQKVFSQQFVKRDRIQAGLAQGVVMIQSDIKGGSLHASRAALDYGRWLAVPLPTSTDRKNEEPKIMANLLITEGDWVDKANLLKCKKDRLNDVLVLRARDDYPGMLSHASLSMLGEDESKSDNLLPAGGLGSSKEQVSHSGNVVGAVEGSDKINNGGESASSVDSLTHQNSLL
ncbi:DNA-processing protein DprA [Pseudomonas soli]|uniref:DNA processing protein n=1 Tax=Pseudomonas soli TaxID=1306993 RepID=A0A1H9F4S1_9PSED|nr:DNA-processing protein DprA [Pseudomonas soli]SEQ32940.1 DNA processing protein [Pseudomonas soli]